MNGGRSGRDGRNRTGDGTLESGRRPRTPMEGEEENVSEILDELMWRGLIAQHTDIDALRAALDEGPVTFYCGFTPPRPRCTTGISSRSKS